MEPGASEAGECGQPEDRMARVVFGLARILMTMRACRQGNERGPYWRDHGWVFEGPSVMFNGAIQKDRGGKQAGTAI